MKQHLIIGVLAVILVAVLAFLLLRAPELTAVSYDTNNLAGAGGGELIETVPEEPYVDDRPVVEHVPLPPQVKAIYMTSCVAGTPSFRQKLVDLMLATEVNAVMIDIKDYSGTISFPPESDAWKPAWQNARCGTADMRELVELLHGVDIFVIGRVTVFQDPFYAPKNSHLAVQRTDGNVWSDHKGLNFIDVAAHDYWDHIVELSKEVYNL